MARVLPSGLVTFAFTDVVGSTRAFTEHGEAYVAALPAVHAAIADCAAVHGGVVVKTEGDGAFLAFPSAVGAVRALLDIHESLEQQPADGLWLRIRAGAHTADAEPVDDDYLALGVHVAARVASAAGAGQVLVTPAVIAELDEEDRASTVDVGSFELKDLQEPMRLWRIAGDDAPPRATPTRRTNVAEPFTRFVGREVEIDELDRLLQDPGLVSVVGAGGMGKTRLLSEYALRRAPDLDAGIWLVELASVTSPDQVAAAVAHALGVSGVPTSATLAVELRRRGEPLLVLDNCEHVADAAAELIGELFAELPRLRVLATSREPLDVEGERVQRLGSLTTPTSLFADRAEAAGGQLTAEDADVVTEICDLLDGLPLAVELAAARTATLPPRELLEALRQGQIELRRRGGPERQRSLESLVGWSLDLLDTQHRDALRVLSVVPDRFTAEMARSLLSAVPGLPALATAELARRSLLDLDGAEYRMLVTIRDVARAELAARPELHDAAMRALFDWAVARAEPESPEPVKAWEARAMEAALECGIAQGLEGCGEVMREVGRWSLTYTRHPVALDIARRVLEQSTPVTKDQIVLRTASIRLLAGLSYLATTSADDVHRLVEAARATGDQDTLVYVASVAAGVLGRGEGLDEAISLQREALQLARLTPVRVRCLVDLGTLHHLRGELAEAERLYQDALEITPRENVNWFVLMGNIGEAQLDAGRYDEAAAQLRTTVAEARGSQVLAAWAFGLLALAEAGRGSPETALALGRQAEAELETAMLTDAGVGYVLDRLRVVMAELDESAPLRQG